jgi:hypothetical protein
LKGTTMRVTCCADTVAEANKAAIASRGRRKRWQGMGLVSKKGIADNIPLCGNQSIMAAREAMMQ